MNNKDRQQLRGMASLMPAVVQIGKDGLSDAVIDSARAALTARELIKAHVLNNANLPTKETMEDLADDLAVFAEQPFIGVHENTLSDGG